MLKDCPTTPNCVSSKEFRKSRYVEPILFTGSVHRAQQRILEILASLKRTRIVEVADEYIRAESVSAIMRYADDIEFVVNERLKLVHVRSASRKGHFDWGVNRRRIEKIRTLFNERNTNENELK